MVAVTSSNPPHAVGVNSGAPNATSPAVANQAVTSQASPNGGGRQLAALARDTTAENPWPLRLLAQKVESYMSKMTPVWVSGQVVQFNPRRGASMAFMTLRDSETEASMTVATYAKVLAAMDSPLEEGSQVVLHAKPTYWLKRGSFQLVADEIRPVGLGQLLAQIERLRRALAAEGLFDPSRKRPLPFLPRVVGLVCGRQAKAKDDVINNARLRWPATRFEIREVAVQGAYAVAEVSRAIAELDQIEQVDVIVVARGGGAVEDLLPFSDEALVRAAAACHTPLVSAIGHETDCPLLDLVADFRASTPTDAARRIVPDLLEELASLEGAVATARTAWQARLEREQQGLEQLRSRPVLSQPDAVINLRQAEDRELTQRMRRAVDHQLALSQAQLHTDLAKLRALSPQSVLDRGYAVLRQSNGDVVTEVDQLKRGTLLEAIVAHGSLIAQVMGTNPKRLD